MRKPGSGALRLALCALAAGLTINGQIGTFQISLAEALNRAKTYGNALNAASLNASLAREDLKQAKAAGLPSVNAFNQFIYTEGNGTPSGVFVANDGVHVYNEQAVVHQELLSLVRRGEVRRAAAAAATAKARVDIAARGLESTVVQNYYAAVAAGRRINAAQLALADAQRFLDITAKLEAGGEVAHADVIKAQLQLAQRKRDLADAQLNADRTKVSLAVLIFPDLQQSFTVTDDLETAPALIPLTEVTTLGAAASPDLRVAQLATKEADLGLTVARYAYLPSFTADFFYGINANQFAARANTPSLAAGGSVNQPAYLIPHRQNLGYSAQITLNIPVWNWGSTQSKVRQAGLRARQADLDLQFAKRQANANIALAYREAEGSQAQLESLRESVKLASESLRLTLLRYQAGEATASEVVDAQAAAATARTGVDDGLVRYRLAVAAVQTLTGTLNP